MKKYQEFVRSQQRTKVEELRQKEAASQAAKRFHRLNSKAKIWTSRTVPLLHKTHIKAAQQHRKRRGWLSKSAAESPRKIPS